MDPVSRRLAAAAMGLAFGLSRDEELEKTRLDLERARMEREDFRNGAGPITEILHTSSIGWAKEHFARMYAMQLLSEETVNKRRRTQNEMFDIMRDELVPTRTLLQKVHREYVQTHQLSQATVNEIIDLDIFSDIDADSSHEDISSDVDVGLDDDSNTSSS